MDDVLDLTDSITDAVTGLLRGVDSSSAAVTDDALLGLLGRAENLGRAVDALRVLVAAEVGDRARPELGTESLAHRRGCGSAAELVERVTRVSSVTARARLRLGARVHRCTGFTGAPLPAAFDAVRDGLVSGLLGWDAAQTITTALTVAGRGTPTDMLGGLRAAEHELVCAATGVSPAPDVAALPPVMHAETKLQAATWVEVLNPDGAEPSERDFAARHVRLLPARGGWVPITGLLAPEVAGQVQRVFDALCNPRQAGNLAEAVPGSGAADADASSDGGVHAGGGASAGADAGGSADAGADMGARFNVSVDTDGIRDPRTRAQRQHDALATVFDIAGRAEELPTLGGASATILVTTLTDDFLTGTGVGHIDGVDVPIPMSAIRQHACANGAHTLELTPAGGIHRLGTEQRTFTRAQRRALAARDGGCIIPGCPIPAAATEAHHVTPWWAGGPTHVDNGVLLCWFHHRTIDTSGWEIRMIGGAPHVKPPPWLGDPIWRPTTQSPTRRTAQLRRQHE
ncbi:HNH endonuclease [Agromyces atrinae]|uniref:HNH endonuclease signature motif containing protein n=1 Tax=Agromyces atrinae TaxID=592376 RepID=UPI001F55C43E|nr:HNH endonuclease signature motif containing protein [Agromyces atrinae]MCI2956214.1 HNH endonuclease [Agromyces atrinae]